MATKQPDRQLSFVRSLAGAYAVTSRRGDVTNVYQVNPNRVSCTCLAGIHGRTCVHLRLVLDYLEGRPNAQRPSPPPPNIKEVA